MGLCTDELRLPLVGPGEATKARIRSVLEKLELIG